MKDLYYQKKEIDGFGTVDKIWIAFVGTGLMLVYPLYASMRAIQSPSTQNGKKWLTYWVLYSNFTLFEILCWKILQRVMIWPYMKLIFFLWLSSFGAAYIYENFARRYTKFRNYIGQKIIEDDSTAKVIQMMSLDTSQSIDRYIEKYGSEAFDRVVQEAESEAQRVNFHRD